MSKRDEQRRIKEQKQQAADQRVQTRKMVTRIVLFGVVPVFLLIVLFTRFTQGPTYSTVEVAGNDHVRGNVDTPVSIVVYADFQCPACAAENQTISLAWPLLRNKAHLIFRHYPITTSHPYSWTASLYAEAAGQQDRFWEMHDMLFANQQVWAGTGDIEQEFDGYALELNLNLEQLHQDMESDIVTQKVRSDQRGGNQAGVRSTPTLFINGTPVVGPRRAQLLQMVDEAYIEANS